MLRYFVFKKLIITARNLCLENHRTDTAYENALIAKTFLFKYDCTEDLVGGDFIASWASPLRVRRFINSYNSLYYIIFFKRYDSSVNGCVDDGRCMHVWRSAIALVSLLSVSAASMLLLALLRTAHSTSCADCLKELQLQLTTIFITLIVVNNLVEIGSA